MRIRLIVMFLCAVLMPAAILAEGPASQPWTRMKTAPDGTQVILYQPQVDDWASHARLDYRLAAEILPPGAKRSIPAALQMTAETNTDLSTRTVVLYNQKIVNVSFPSADEATAQKLTTLLTQLVPSGPLKMSVDLILSYEGDAEASHRTAPEGPVQPVPAAPEAPVILCRTTPAVLVIFDGEPVFAPVEGTALQFALNTNWLVLREAGKTECYLLNETFWLKGAGITGPWAPAGKLPRSFWALPKEEQWADARAHLPGKSVSAAKAPKVLVSFKPAELILLKGAPARAAIPGTGLSWVKNTESDLFWNKADQSFYFLVSGRWFRSLKPEGPWAAVAGDALPADFARIPADHAKGKVRVSVPGTPEAKEAAMLAQVPHKAEVKRSEVTVDVKYSGDPEFKPVEGTTLAYAVNTAFDVIKFKEKYYCCHQAVWFVAVSPAGPWAVADSVPKEIYTIPPSNPKYNVTYVTVYESTPSTVTTGYTAGYLGAFVIGACVVYGSGYYYPPYWYYPPGIHYPVYYPRPYSYGCAAAYNPYTGTFARGAVAYGPYGGCGHAAAYNPYTGTYARGAAAWGPYGGRGYAEAYNPYTGAWGQKAAAYGPGGQAAYAARGYNPSTGRGGATYQRSSPYANWGQSVVTKGDEWARTAHYSDSRGTMAGYETSQGGKGVGISTDHGTTTVRKTHDDDLYATHDGNVYKKSDDGSWQKYEDGSWNSVNKPTPQEKSASRTSATANTQQAKSAGTGTVSADRVQATATGSGSARSSASDSWNRDSRQLQRDHQARSDSARRQRSFDSWRSGSGGSSGGGRARGRRR